MRSTRPTIGVRSSLWYAFSVAFLVFADKGRAQPLAQAQPSVAASERYVPFACSEIVGREWARIGRDRVLTWRDRWPDTTAAGNTFGADQEPRILAKARACVAHYSVATTRPDQLIGLGATYLTLNDTARAAEAFERLITLGVKQSIEQRAFDLSQIVSAYINANWESQALSYMARLDALGPAVAGRRIAMHNELYKKLFSPKDNIPRMLAEVNAARVAANELRGDARHEWLSPWEWSTVYAMDLEGRRKNFARARQLKAEAGVAWDSVKPGESILFWALMVNPVLAVGDSAPPLESQIVYLPGEKKPSTAPLITPVRGKVSLIVHVPGGLTSDEMGTYRLVAELRRKFPANVLDITLAAQTMGVSFERLQMVDNPLDEAELIRAFYHDYLRLAVPIAVRVNTFETDPKTGRRSRVERTDPRTHMTVNDPYRTLTYKLIDKFGIVRDVLGGSPRLENMIRELSAE